MALAIHTTVTFPHKSGFVRDQVVNTFTFAGEADWDAGGFTELETALADFYNGAHTSGHPISQYIGPQISRTTAPMIRHYNLDGHLTSGRLGSPIRMQPMALLGAPSLGNGMPSEVACALSFHSDYATDAEFGPGTRPRARDRGRVYIGPLTLDTGVATTDTTAGRVFVGTALRTAVLEAGEALLAADKGPGQWCVWSRKNGTVRNVRGLWVDDGFDTQRRRGERAINRTSVET